MMAWYLPKTGGLETQEELLFRFRYEDGLTGRILHYSGEGQPFCSIQAFN